MGLVEVETDTSLVCGGGGFGWHQLCPPISKDSVPPDDGSGNVQKGRSQRQDDPEDLDAEPGEGTEMQGHDPFHYKVSRCLDHRSAFRQQVTAELIEVELPVILVLSVEIPES